MPLMSFSTDPSRRRDYRIGTPRRTRVARGRVAGRTAGARATRARSGGAGVLTAEGTAQAVAERVEWCGACGNDREESRGVAGVERLEAGDPRVLRRRGRGSRLLLAA